jgi:hypothetical protein
MHCCMSQQHACVARWHGLYVQGFNMLNDLYTQAEHNIRHTAATACTAQCLTVMMTSVLNDADNR